MAKVQKLEESLLATENVISSLEKSRDSDKVDKVRVLYFYILFIFGVVSGVCLVLEPRSLCVALRGFETTILLPKYLGYRYIIPVS